MARKKKPPTFGQHALPGDYIPSDRWVPWSDLSNMTTNEGVLARGNEQQVFLSIARQFLDPGEVSSYQSWAAQHPTMDPRTWAPLAKAYVSPFGPDANSVSAADIASQVDAGTFDHAPSASTSGTGTGGPSPLFPSANAASPFANIPQPQRQSVVPEESGDNPLTSFLGTVGGWIGDQVGQQVSQMGDQVRLAQYGLQTGWDFVEGMMRQGQASTDKAAQIADKYALSDEERLWVTQENAGAKGVDPLAGAGFGPMLGAPGIGDPTGRKAYTDASPERKALLEKARAEWNTNPESTGMKYAVSKAAEGTPLGQIAQNPELVTNDKGILASNPAVIEGVIVGDKNPATGVAYTKATKGTERVSLEAYDMRTPEEIARGIQPIGYTPGRSIAHIWYSPDEQAFNTLSGIIDFNANLFLDPVNLIPAGWAGKVVKGGAKGAAFLAEKAGADASRIPFAIERGMATGGPKVAVQTTLGGFGKQGGFQGARLAARGKAAMDATDIVNRVVDPAALDMAERAGGEVAGKITAEGLVTTPHGNFVVNQAAWEFLNSGRGQRVVDALVDESSASRIWLRSNRKMDPALAKELADANTPERVRAILGTRLGMDLNDPKALRNFGSQAPALFRDGVLRDSGLYNALRKAPHLGVFDLDDASSTLNQLERFGRGARMSWDSVQPHLDNALNATNSAERYQAIYGEGGFLSAVADHLSTDVGISREQALQVTRAFKGGLDEELRNFVNAGIADGTVGAGTADGSVGSAMLMSEMLNRAAVLPDYRTIRSLSSSVARIERRANLGFIRDSEKSLMIRQLVNEATTVWKGAVLVRPAYVMREVGEMLFASSLAGYDSAFTNPARFASLVIGTAIQKESSSAYGRLAKALATGEVPALPFDRSAARIGAAEAAGEPIHAAALKASRAAKRVTYGAAAAPMATVRALGGAAAEAKWYALNQNEFTRSLADWLNLDRGVSELIPTMRPSWSRINGDPMFEALNAAMRGEEGSIPHMYDGLNAGAEGNLSVDQRLGTTAAKYGIGIASRDDLAVRDRYVQGLIDKIAAMAHDGDMKNLANPDVDFARALTAFRASGRRDIKATAQPGHFASNTDEQYLQGYLDILNHWTGNDATLRQAVVDGTFGGLPLDSRNKPLAAYIREILDDPNRKGQMAESVRYEKAGRGDRARAELDRVMGRFFETTGEVSDLFARGPLFRQAYTDRAVELVPEMSAAAKAETVSRLRASGDTELARRVQGAGRANGSLSIEDVDMIAGNHARTEAKRVFYDAHEQQNYAVAIRALMPFAQATFNTFRRWGEFSLRNPQLMYRSVKPFVYGQQEGAAATIYGGLGALYGDGSTALYDPSTYPYMTPDQRHAATDGFIYTDQYGDQRFAYPLVGLMGQWAGIPSGAMPTSSLGGLNVAGTSIWPGLGPTVTFPVSLLSAPQDWMTEQGFVGNTMRFMFPYGLPQGDWYEKAGAAFSPSWFQKMVKSSDEVSFIPNMSTKLMPVLLQNGDYDLTSVADQNRLARDSKALSTKVFFWNAVFGALAPSTMNTTVLVKPNGMAGQDAYSTTPERAAVVEAMIANDPTDANGDVTRFILQDKMKQEFDRYTSGPGQDAYNTGMLNFVHDYGPSALLSVLPRTQGENQSTNDVWSFYSAHPDTYDNYRPVIGLFFAGGSGSFRPGDTSPDAFASPMYQAQKQSGERVQKTPDQFVQDAMREFGYLVWNPKADEIDANPSLTQDQKDSAKRDLAAHITSMTGGYWSRQSKDPGKTTRQIEQITQAVQDEDVMTLRSAPAIKEYLDLRSDLLAEAQRRGTGQSFSSQQNGDLAYRLLMKANELRQSDRTGGFSNAFHRLFSNEFGA